MFKEGEDAAVHESFQNVEENPTSKMPPVRDPQIMFDNIPKTLPDLIRFFGG